MPTPAPEIVKVLARHGVLVPEEWSPTGPFESLAPLPLLAGLVGGAVRGRGAADSPHEPFHLGVGQGSVRSGLKAAGVDLRPKGQDVPWTTRRRAG
jgi:hypothetical protein